ncbi:MAG: hypothetical protein OXH65_05185 [Paracoccaceae bacterium]|nr:hypothetical protein [Paracoccaceae bacterium]MDE2674485.1 hypothetical protein [Paracoccaceae bacterium]
MNTITESYDRGWKHLEAKIGEDNAKKDAEFSKLREDLFLARRQARPYIQDSEKEIANAGKQCLCPE